MPRYFRYIQNLGENTTVGDCDLISITKDRQSIRLGSDCPAHKALCVQRLNLIEESDLNKFGGILLQILRHEASSIKWNANGFNKLNRPLHEIGFETV